MMSFVISGAAAVLMVASSWPSTVAAADAYLNPNAVDTIEWLPSSQSDYRILYGSNASNFGDLRLPKVAQSSADGHPILVFVHGGGWTADWTLGHTEQLVEALNKEGVATWSLEYRRLGNSTGGYPETFLDVANALDFLRKIAPKHHLDLGRVVVAGHSSGGHLALWLAGRRNLPKTSRLFVPDPLTIKGVISLAGVVDLEDALKIGNRTDTLRLLNVTDADAAAPLWPETNPMRLLPFGIPQMLIVGTRDNPWRVTITKNFAQAATAKGDEVRLIVPEGANHFDVIHARGPVYPMISTAMKSMFGM
jgi:acetyl esterase/lipase